MAFLTLNGTTVPCRANQIGQKDEEHGIDRLRMFDGTLRMTRRGIYREWTVTTTLLEESDANTLLALIRTNSPPLTAGGDLVGDEVAVMPIPGSNDPVITAQGFRRQLKFGLKETGGLLPPDTSASVFLFLRAGTRIYSDNDGLIAAGSGDRIGRWVDATGNGRYVTTYFSNDYRPKLDGTVVQFDEAVDGSFGTTLVFGAATITAWNALTSAEIMASVKADVFPPASNGKGAMWWMGGESGGNTYYSKTDSHIYGCFGVGNVSDASYDCGLAPDDLSDAYHVFGESSDATSYNARFNNEIIKTVLTTEDDHTVLFDTVAPAIGHGNPGVNEHWLGRIKHLVILSGEPTTSQRRSWYDFLRGATDDPPLPE